MESKEIIAVWFEKWKQGDYLNLPLTPDFSHTSPFGTISGKDTYLDLIRSNEDKFLGYTFDILDTIYREKGGCVRYRAVQGDFELDVSEWYYLEGDLIKEIVSYYHIGEIQEERKLKE